MNDEMKTLLGLAIRRGLTVLGTSLAAHGLLTGGITVESFVGSVIVLGEVGIEAYRRWGTVLVNAVIARAKGVHPAQVQK